MTSAAADNYISPELIQVSTPVYRPEFSQFSPALGTYTYEVAWQGIPAATINVEIAQDDMHYRASVSARTAKGIDIFYKLRYYAKGIISSYDLSPINSEVEHQENSNIKTTKMTFSEDGNIEVIRQKKGKDPQSLNFNPQNFTLDPFSAAFLARSLPWEVGQSRQFDTFNGKSRYLITLTAVDKVTMKVNGRDREVWVISPKVVNLTQAKPSNKLRSAEIYVTADKERDILQIVSKVFIGSVKTKLTGFVPSSVPAPTMRIARAREGSILR